MGCIASQSTPPPPNPPSQLVLKSGNDKNESVITTPPKPVILDDEPKPVANYGSMETKAVKVDDAAAESPPASSLTAATTTNNNGLQAAAVAAVAATPEPVPTITTPASKLMHSEQSFIDSAEGQFAQLTINHLGASSTQNNNNINKQHSSNDRKLNQFLTAAFEEEDLVLSRQNTPKNQRTPSFSALATAGDQPATGTSSGSPKAVISPVQRLSIIKTPISQSHNLHLSDLPILEDSIVPTMRDESDGDGEYGDEEESRSPSVRPNTTAVALQTQNPISPPPTKRGFLVQTSPLGDGQISSPGKAFNVLDEGRLYQIDPTSSIATSSAFLVDNRTISLKHASVEVEDDTVNIVTEEPQENLRESFSSGRRVVSFSIRDARERTQWIEALKQHIEFSEADPV